MSVLKVAIVPSVMGILAVNEEGGIVDKEVFEKDAVKIAEKLFALEQGRIIPEVRSLVERLKIKNYTLVFERQELAEQIREELKVNTEVKSLATFTEKMRENMGEIGVEVGFLKEPSEISTWIREVTIELSKFRIKKATEKR
ncbi:MAG: hypothetical protein QXY57_06045, partial [Candidatus Bathyarchaeia archaeon]